jgi:hypothetical protein
VFYRSELLERLVLNTIMSMKNAVFCVVTSCSSETALHIGEYVRIEHIVAETSTYDEEHYDHLDCNPV